MSESDQTDNERQRGGGDGAMPRSSSRKALLDAFKADRDAVLAEHRQAFETLGLQHLEERKLALQEADQRREGFIQGIKEKEVPEQSLASLWAAESARQKEAMQLRHEQEREDLGGKLPGIPDWQAFLESRAKAGDELAREVLDEIGENAAAGKGPGLEGQVEGPVRPLVMEGLTTAFEKDKEIVHYKRAEVEVFADVGKRIEVKKTDEQNVEAALRLAAAKFKTGTALAITGDDVFRADAARIAGRLGIAIKNPELQQIWQEERARAREAGLPEYRRVADPEIVERNGISGEGAESARSQAQEAETRAGPGAAPGPEMREVSTPASSAPGDPTGVVVDAQPALVEAAAEMGIQTDGGTVTLPADQYLAASSALAKMEASARLALMNVQVAAVPVADGLAPAISVAGMKAEEIAALASVGATNEQGMLTGKGLALILVQDHEIRMERERAPELYKELLETSHEAAERRQRDQEQAQDQKRLLVRNEDEQAVQAEEKQEKVQEKEVEQADKALGLDPARLIPVPDLVDGPSHVDAERFLEDVSMPGRREEEQERDDGPAIPF
jgi:hypothetical protein